MDQVTTNDVGVAETNQIPILEKAFLPETDSSTEVAAFSSRGNVGVGVEGEGGRFKPDVVAPVPSLFPRAASTGKTRKMTRK